MQRRTTSPKTQRLGLRASDRQRALLAAASRAEGTTVSEFVLKHATRAAEAVLADRRVFLLSDDEWQAFDAAIDEPPRDVAGLRELMTQPSALEADASS